MIPILRLALLWMLVVGCQSVRIDHGDGDPRQRGDDGQTIGDSLAGDSVSRGPCAEPPCFRIADSPTMPCYDANTNVAPCPSDGEPRYGQDGSFLIPAPSFRIDGATVVDELSGLVWLRAPAGPFDFAGAEAHCASEATLTGEAWRMPTYLELVSISDYGHNGGLVGTPAIDTALFPLVATDVFWSSDPYLADLGSQWVFQFGTDPVWAKPGSETAQVLCVRGESPPHDRFSPTGGRVVDRKTGLEWQNSQIVTDTWWADTLQICIDLELDGFDDWRLPTMKELHTIVDRRRTAGPLYADLQHVSTQWHWSSTNTDVFRLWVLDADGHQTEYSTVLDMTVRCVRGGGTP